MTQPTLFELDFTSGLAATSAQVAAMTGSQRRNRLDALLVEADRIFNDTIEQFITGDGRTVAGVVPLFSGGNDSTTLAHLFRDRATHMGHANTGVGIEATREFVRNTTEEWGIPLLEKAAPRLVDSYRELVLTRDLDKKGRALGGFPGPAMHWKMYNRLKERAFEAIRNELVRNPRRERVAFIAGRRREESQRRSNIPENGRKGSIVWVSPLIHWTKIDLNTYRLAAGEVPVNRVTDLIHMSGECLCGAYASPGERMELEYWFPDDMDAIRQLEQELMDRDDIPDYRKTWGWGAVPELLAQARADERKAKSAGLCGRCIARYEQAGFDFTEVA